MYVRTPTRRFVLKILQRYLVIVLALSFLLSCASVKQSPPERVSTLVLTDISEGLPRDGQWRQNIALFDMDGDGFLDVVAPPPRAAEEGENMPHVFLRDHNGGRWKEGAYTFPSLKGYGYGGVAVADINGDGYPDIVLAVHEGRIIILENNKSNGFVERPFPVKDLFHSRTVGVSDINGDGWPDIIALLGTAFSGKSHGTKGILLGVNKEGTGWDVKTLEGSETLFGDSMAIGNIKGNGNTDIIIAPLIHKNERVKLVWLGDGKGNFKVYDGDLISGDVGDVITEYVRAGNIDGDGKDEIVFSVEGFGPVAKDTLHAYKWTGAAFDDISKGLDTIEPPIVFDLADVDGNGKKELIVLSAKGLSIYQYADKGWTESGYYQLPSAETMGAYDLRAGRNKDGSLLIVYNLGRKEPTLNLGIRAYILK